MNAFVVTVRMRHYARRQRGALVPFSPACFMTSCFVGLMRDVMTFAGLRRLFCPTCNPRAKRYCFAIGEAMIRSDTDQQSFSVSLHFACARCLKWAV